MTANSKTQKGMLVTLVLVSMLNIMGGAAVAPALPAMTEAFPEAGETMVSLVLTLPPLAVALSGLFIGALADRVGKARTLTVSIVVFTIAGLSGLFLPSLEAILVSRFIMGIAIAGITTSTGALVSECFDAQMRAKVFGWQNAATGASILALDTCGGFLSMRGWRAPFLVYSVGILFAILVLLFIREPQNGAAKGQAPLGETDARGNSRVLQSAPMVVAICLGGAFVTPTLSYLVPSKMPYLLAGFGVSPAVTGLFLGGFGIAGIVGSLVCAPLQERVRRLWIVAVCFAALACGCLTMTFASNMWMVLVGVVFMGAGAGCMSPVLMSWLASQSTTENSGKHMGAYATALNLGQFACSPLTGATLAVFGTHQAVFAVGACIGFAASCVSLALDRRLGRQ